jgi:hypothetical protein
LGEEWPLGAQVTITSDDPTTPQSPDFTIRITVSNTRPGQIGGSFELLPTMNSIRTGFTISVSDGITTKSLIVSNPNGAIDVVNDRVTGTTDPNRDVSVLANKIMIQTRSDDAGYWSADFTGKTELQPDSAVEIRFFDNDGDFTSHTKHVAIPYIQAGPNQGYVYAEDWPTGIVLHMTVERSGSTIYTADATVGPCGDGSPARGPCTPDEAYFDLGYHDLGRTPIELLPGDIVTLTGGGITKSMIVSTVQATYIDLSTSTFRGIADIGRDVQVCVPIGTGDIGLWTIPDSSGHWMANLAPLHIAPGDGCAVIQGDGNGNATVQGWSAPDSHITVSIQDGWINANEWDWLPIHGNWMPGTELTMAIDDPSSGVETDYTGMAVMNLRAEDPGHQIYTQANFAWPEIGLKPGFIVEVSGNGTIKTLITSPLKVNAVDVGADTVSGIANPGATVEVCVSIPNNCLPRHVTADSSGHWLANYHDPGLQPDDQETVDIQGDTTGWATERDDDGDETEDGWHVPSNQPPVADAGGPYSVYAAGTVTLDASASSDLDGDVLTYEWDLDNDGQYDDASGVIATTSFNQVGDHVIGLRVTDEGGLSDADTATVTVLPWTLQGFYQPVDMNGVYNIVKSGSTVPFKFEIFAGPTELTDTAYIKSFISAPASCTTSVATDDIEQTVTGGTSLRYDATEGQFIYNWKMPKTAGKCYRITMTAIDGSSLVAYFKLK